MGLSSFNFLWWAPKHASLLEQYAYRPFKVSKVVDLGTNRKGVCDFILVIVPLVLSCTISEIRRVIG